MGENTNIIIYMIFFTICIALFNATGVACTKYASAAQRSTIDTSRTLTIWIFSCLIFHEPFMPLEIPGFIMLVFGTLLYNEILVIPYLGFNENTKAAIALRNGTSGASSSDYKSSPGTAYDSKRNTRNLQAKMNGENMEGDDFEMDQPTGYNNDVNKSDSLVA